MLVGNNLNLVLCFNSNKVAVNFCKRLCLSSGIWFPCIEDRGTSGAKTGSSGSCLGVLGVCFHLYYLHVLFGYLSS